MAKRSLDNQKDTDAVNNALEGNSKGRIKLDKKTYIRLLSKDYVAEFVHYINKKPVVCLGNYDKDKGYNPKKCPTCKKVEKLWDKYNKVKIKSGKKEILDEINNIRSIHQTFMDAIKGIIKTEEDDDGNLKSYVEWEKEAKVLSISKSQWSKLTLGVFEDYDYMKSPNDLVNRNFVFKKEDKKGKDGNDFTEVQIVPSKKKSKASEIENDLPDLESQFVYVSKEEMIELLKEELSDDNSIEDEDLIEEKEEKIEKSSKKPKPKSEKKTTKSKKKKEEKKEQEEETPDFVTDEDKEDDGFEDIDVDNDFESEEGEEEENNDDDDEYDDFEDD